MKLYCYHQYYKKEDRKLYCRHTDELCVAQKFCHVEERYVLSEYVKSRCKQFKKI